MTAVAGQTHDLVLGGDGFMLAQGGKGTTSYKKSLDGPVKIGLSPADNSSYEVLHGSLDAPVQSFRRAIWSKWTGLGQGMVAGADGWDEAKRKGRVYDLLRLRPVQQGGALALTPQGVDATVDASALTLAANTHFVVHIGAITVVAFGPKIFTSLNPGTNNSGFVLKATASGNIQGMCLWNNTVLVSVGGVLNTFNVTTGAFAAFIPAQTCTLITSYQGGLVGFNNNQLVFLTPGGTAWASGYIFENNINAIEELNGALYIGTHTALYRLQGQFQPKSVATAPNTLDYFNYSIAVVWRSSYFNVTNFHPQFNFASMAAWKGYLWFFFGGRLYRAAPVSGKDTIEPEAQPVVGACVGLRVCGDLLVVITQQATGESTVVWANDGTLDARQGLGWFKLETGRYYFFPFPNAGYPQGGVNALIFDPATSHVFTRWLVDLISPVGFRADNYAVARTAVTGQVTLPLVTPEDLGQLAGATNGKVLAVNFRRVGMEWSVIDGGVWWPGGAGFGGASPVIGIEVSLDSGANWLTLTDPSGGPGLSPATFNHHRLEFPADLNFYSTGRMYPSAAPNGIGPGGFLPPPDVGWTIRITFGGTEAPLLRRVWIDYDVAEVSEQTGRTWQFEVNLAEPQIGLAGAVEISPDDATSKAGRLWNLVVSGASTTFSDIDGQNYRVKVVGFEQKRLAQGAMPGLSPEWSGTVRLVEVWPGN